MTAISYDTCLETQGVRIPYVPAIITPKIEKVMRNNRYEGGEAKTLRAVLEPGDRVLELGAGVGLCSTIAAHAAGVEQVVAIEANPDLIPMIRETHRLNDAERVDLRNAGATGGAVGPMDFYLRHDFWASSMEPDSRPYERVVQVPAVDINTVIAELRPTVIVCDIEGGELPLFTNPALDLGGVRLVLLELHPKVFGEEGLARITGTLAARGFYVTEDSRADSSVQLFERREGVMAPPEGSLVPARAVRDWAALSAPAAAPQTPAAAPQAASATGKSKAKAKTKAGAGATPTPASAPTPAAGPRILIGTCMKDEGPYILEWIAWHRAMGVTDIVVFTNDCTDGTAELLDHLHDRGLVTHLPNPALATAATAFQPIALNYLHHMRVFREADFVISMDVDEFVNVKPGAGRFADLFAATGPFDALSISEVNHGCNDHEAFARGWLTEMFPRHETLAPGRHRCRRGVKTITRPSVRLAKIRNHRPDFLASAKPVLWLDGSGRYLPVLQAEPDENGIDVRGSYDLVTLDHFPLRSMQGFFMKMLRGDVVVAKKSVSQRYWRVRNRNEHTSSKLNPAQLAAAKAFHAAQFESDPALMALHEACCAFHEKRIAEIATLPEIAERRAWILEHSWTGAPEAESEAADQGAE